MWPSCLHGAGVGSGIIDQLFAGQGHEDVFQRGQIAVLRYAALEIVRRILRHKFAAVYDRDAVAEQIGFFHIMRGNQNCGVVSITQFFDECVHFALGTRIKTGGGFVEQATG